MQQPNNEGWIGRIIVRKGLTGMIVKLFKLSMVLIEVKLKGLARPW
jgi:hypothetical protein